MLLEKSQESLWQEVQTLKSLHSQDFETLLVVDIFGKIRSASSSLHPRGDIYLYLPWN